MKGKRDMKSVGEMKFGKWKNSKKNLKNCDCSSQILFCQCQFIKDMKKRCNKWIRYEMTKNGRGHEDYWWDETWKMKEPKEKPKP